MDSITSQLIGNAIPDPYRSNMIDGNNSMGYPAAMTTAANSMLNTANGPTAITDSNTNLTHAWGTKEMEIIDLCSDSDSEPEEDEKVAPALSALSQGQKMRLPQDDATIVIVNKEQDLEAENTFSGVLWKTTKMSGNRDGDVDVDVDMMVEKNGVKEEEEVPAAKAEVEAEAEAEALMSLLGAEGDFDLSIQPATSEGVKDVEESPTILQVDKDSNDLNDPRITISTTADTSLRSATDDDIVIELSDATSFFISTHTSSAHPHASESPAETVKPAPRTETIQTPTGDKKRKLIGPFIFEDETGYSPEDEGYGSLSFTSRRSSKPGLNVSSGCSSDPDSPNSSGASIQVGHSRVVGMEGTNQWQKRQEDRCAAVSRRMREEALARRKREADLQDEPPMGLWREFLEDGLEGRGRADSRWSTSAETYGSAASHTAISRTNEDFPSRSLNGESAGIVDDDNEYDDLFSDKNPAPETIEAQLDFAQRYITTGNDDDDHNRYPSPEDVSRSYKPSTHASPSAEEADVAADSGLRGRDDRDAPLHDSIPHHGRQPPNGNAGKTVTSGIERYDRERAEKSLRRATREERRKREKWPQMIRFENTTGEALNEEEDNSAGFGIVGGAKGRDEASLLAAKEPLRAAPNTNGGLARLVKIAAEKDGEVGDRYDHGSHDKGSASARRAILPNKAQGRQDSTIDERSWTKEGTPKDRKRAIENVMNTLNETARCWWIAFGSMSSRMQGHMGSHLRELLTDFARPIFSGYSPKHKFGKRLTDIRANMSLRISRYVENNPYERAPTQQEVDQQLIVLIGKETLQRGKSLRQKVDEEYEEWKKIQDKRSHHKSGSTRNEKDGPGRVKQMRQSKTPYKGRQEFAFELDDSDPYEGLNLTTVQRVAWQREDARIEKLKKARERYEVDRPSLMGQSTRKVRFADPAIWEEDPHERQGSESEESDEDEGETAPSFGRGETSKGALPQRIEAVAIGLTRKTVGGKGMLSDLRKENDIAEANTDPRHGLMTRKGSHDEGEDFETNQRRQDPPSLERSNVGGKSVPGFAQQEPRDILKAPVEHSDIEDDQRAPVDVESEVDDSFREEEDEDDTYDDDQIPQHDIVADYENFDGFQDASSVLLGRHIDVKAALRQMIRVTSDVVASVSRRYRQLRIFWDTDDFQLASQTIILPTGGECRIRMMKSWTSAVDWPGRQRDRATTVPRVFYVVHETKTTSLKLHADGDRPTRDDEVLGPEDFEDPNAIVEKERDMCFSSRQRANEVAKNRLVAFSGRYDTAEDAGGGVAATELAEYMEQIEHDKAGFGQARDFRMKDKEGRIGKVSIKIWVEELIADMPHV